MKVFTVPYVFLFFFLGCGAQVHQSPVEEPYIEAVFSSELPDPPEDIDQSKRIVLPVSKCEVEGADPPQETLPGIYMTHEMAARAGRTKIAYDEMRGLYDVDLRTMERERMVYQKQLDLADREVVRLRELAKRSWLERNRGWFGLSIGLAVGAGLAIGMAAALDGVTDAVE